LYFGLVIIDLKRYSWYFFETTGAGGNHGSVERNNLEVIVAFYVCMFV